MNFTEIKAKRPATPKTGLYAGYTDRDVIRAYIRTARALKRYSRILPRQRNHLTNLEKRYNNLVLAYKAQKAKLDSMVKMLDALVKDGTEIEKEAKRRGLTLPPI